MSLPKLIQKIINNVGYGQELAGADNDVVHKTGDETIDGVKTFSGAIQQLNTGTFIKRVDNDGRVVLCGGMNAQSASGAKLYLNGSGYGENEESGAFALQAGKSGAYYQLLGNTDGTLIWRAGESGTGIDITGDVHTTGDETIDGIKTFSKQVKLSRSISSSTSDGNYMYIHHMGMTKGVLPETQKSFWTLWMDSTDGGTNAAGFASRWIGLRTNGETVYRVSVSRNVANNDSWGYLELIQTADGVNYATAPSTPTTGTNTDILTRNWIPKDTRIVHTTGDETITGNKTFQYLNVSVHNGGDISLISPVYARGEADSKFYSGIVFLDKNSQTNVQFIFHSYGDNGLRPELCWYMKDPLGTNGDVVIRTRRDRTSSTTDNNYFHPDPDNTVYLGNGSSRWKQLFAATSTISTSDERCKEEISSIDNKILDAWEEVDWLQFKFTDAIEEKGLEKARIHSGLIAQRIDSIFKSHEIDTSKYAFFCYDEWDAVPEERDKKGNLLSKAKEAGNRYSIRYEEALCMEAAYNRRRVSRVEERLLALEQELAELKNSAA